jgi:choline kinase
MSAPTPVLPTNPTKTAVLLVAGIGSRLRPLTDDRPKALMDLGGQTLLGHAVKTLLGHGIEDIVLATGYREDAVRNAMEAAGVGARIHYCRNEAFESTQNAVSLLLCEQAIGGRDFFKLDGDLLFDVEVLGRLEAAGEGRPGIAAAIDARANLGEEEMKVTVDASHTKLTAFGKGLDPRRSFGESIGIERVSGDAVSSLFHGLRDAYATGRTQLYYEDVYSELLGKGVEGFAVAVSDLPWMEIDTPEDLAKARAMFATGRFGT